MTAFWTEADYDDHELVHFVRDPKSGLTAIIALHSTHLGPGAGGTRFWHYAEPGDAMRDALRLSRGMSYKNAMAGLPMGGGKAVIVADADKNKTPEMLVAFADAVEGLGGRYVTAEDVGISEADMAAVAQRTQYVSGLPVEGDEAAGGDPGPFTALGIFLGIKAAVAYKLGKDSVEGVHVAIQGTGSVGGGVARLLAREGAQLTLSDMQEGRAEALARELDASVAAPEAIMSVACDVFSPNALGAILDDEGIARLDCQIVAGGANNQLRRPEHGPMLAERGILYAPDYVINAGGIISVTLEYLCRNDQAPCDINEVRKRIALIPGRLEEIWNESAANGASPDQVADRMAQRLIGRG
ncbi:Glu/Leu/Phe/Val dehydrogenase dimerization domain-containing protein [Qipengyuania sp. XHP0207]|uniref:Leu/Phe/Val dehydrogenase n=1 Tax=Qipengyuania sp. XHP0207 TaxID=3038078 RepID=UPI00241F2151|nr:Glu/Leu/Phe/Val dehydrogenase dimerization domain-containing protein [Qipengyuania sp. XHP0207]MDG5748648.1 Glu/Leu/Phe/Val dehydrogenase dimerization domain-containing protein [Qipengyuania sp. XHP0207]